MFSTTITQYYLSFYLNSLYTIIFSLFTLNFLINTVVYYFTKNFSWKKQLNNLSVMTFIKFNSLVFLTVLCVLFLNAILHLSKFLLNAQYLILFQNYYCNSPLKLTMFQYYLSVDYLGLFFCFLACLVGFLSFMALDTRFYWKNFRFLIMCNLLCFFIFLFTSTNDIFLLLIFYESLLIPSFLFVYFVSPYKRAVQASLYFLIWTQIGSLLVLISVGYCFFLTNDTSLISLRSFIFLKDEANYLYYLFFFGFGFKIPIWPFHQWLTKTHVEAPAGFSMFLSGFLVKSALFGFYKLSNVLSNEVLTNFCSMFLVMGVIDASLKMWGQHDLKKLIAYGTVQEMNLLTLAFIWGDTHLLWGGILFSLMHASLSSLLFYTVDCVQRRFNTRSLLEVLGILLGYPNLGTTIFFNSVLYAGLPGTLKFLCEFYLFSTLLECSPLTIFLILINANWFGILGFSKCWFTSMFGMFVQRQKMITLDLTIKEFLLIVTCYLTLFTAVYLNTYYYIIW